MVRGAKTKQNERSREHRHLSEWGGVGSPYSLELGSPGQAWLQPTVAYNMTLDPIVLSHCSFMRLRMTAWTGGRPR